MSVVIPPPRTKIVATLGPASSSPEMVRSLMERGMNFVRINASYGNHESQASLIAVVRAASKKTGKPVGILYDLQGPKIRIGRFQGDPISIQSGSTFDIAVGREPEGNELPTDYSELDG
ncbi:MAG: pyruvate kinase, partial [Planctomycetota bacterium]